VVSFLSGAIGGAAGVLVGLNFNAIQPFMGEHMIEPRTSASSASISTMAAARIRIWVVPTRTSPRL
jgi:hypothetical protein